MKRMAITFLCSLPFVGLVVSCSDVSVPQDGTALVDPYTPDERFIPSILVKAKAIDTALHDNSRTHITTFEIVHVYAGPAQLQGTKFRLGLPSAEPMSGRNLALWYYPLPTTREVGIWALMRWDDQFGGEPDSRVCPTGEALFPVRKLRPGLLQDQSQPYPFPPYRQGIHENYDEMVKWAEAVEAAYRAKGAERRAKLIQSSKSENKMIAAWASDLLERIDHADREPDSYPPPFPKRKVRPTQPAAPVRPAGAPQTTMKAVPLEQLKRD
jgi:hypothetical protein